MKKKMLLFSASKQERKNQMHLLDIVDIFNKGGYEVIIRATRQMYEQVKEYADQVDLIAYPVEVTVHWMR